MINFILKFIRISFSFNFHYSLQTIPLPDFNQSPRNMYQCQMGKQTMASPTHTWHLTSETKLYRLQTPTSPFFRPAHYDTIGMDDYPMGTNAVVAVISYTG
jgi:DNA-directed RNA polymerase I subunit RPA2